MIKKALILVAGLGSRLDPITKMLPKCMVEVNGTPILINTLNHLAANGFKEVVIVTGHMESIIKNKIGTQFWVLKHPITLIFDLKQFYISLAGMLLWPGSNYFLHHHFS